jgi:hypothetical protein
VEQERLAGGRTVAVVRVGDAVHRPVQATTPATHAVLRHLATVGFDGAPRVLGFDEQGRERLTYLEGETVGETLPWPAWVFSDAALEQVGTWMRRLHDATAGFRPPADLTFFAGARWQPGLVIGHHDAAPFNAVWRDGRLVGFVDWDTAGPATRELDLAYAALMWVPLSARAFAERVGFTAFDDRARRLRVLLDAYGYAGDRLALQAVVSGRARRNAEVIRQLAAGGAPTYTAMLPLAAQMDQTAREVDALPPAFWT